MTKRIKYLTILTIIFALFQFYKFVRIRIINLDLPKGKIVFSSMIDGDSEIYSMNINGTDLRQLTKNSVTKVSLNIAIDEEPSFSPDGRKIVFVSGRQGAENRRIVTDARGKLIGQVFSGGTSDIYTMVSDGKDQIPLTYNSLSSHPFFTPDAKKIVFDSLLKNNHNLKKILDIDTSAERILNFGGGLVEFSSDGRKMFDNFQNDLSVINTDGTNKVKLTYFSESKELNGNKDNFPGIAFSASSDGKKIALVTIGRKNRSLNGIFKFYTMNIDGSDLKEVYNLKTIRGLGFMFGLKYSFDGNYIVFNASLDNSGIYILNLKEKILINLTEERERWNRIFDFTFTPDGKRIVFIADITPKNYYFHAVILRNIKAYINSLLFRKSTPYYDNKFLCIMDIDGKNFRRIAKLPIGAEFGRDFIHWEK